MGNLKVTIITPSFEICGPNPSDVRIAAHAEVRAKRYDVVVWSRPGHAHCSRDWSIRGWRTGRMLRYGVTLEAIVLACQEHIDAWIGSVEHKAQRRQAEGKRLSGNFIRVEHEARMAKQHLAEKRRELAKARRALKSFHKKYPDA